MVLGRSVCGLEAKTDTAAGQGHCIHSPEEAAEKRRSLGAVQRSSVAADGDVVGSLAARIDCMRAEALLEAHKMAAVGPHRAHVAADKGKKAHMAMDCDRRLVGRTDCTGHASRRRMMAKDLYTGIQGDPLHGGRTQMNPSFVWQVIVLSEDVIK